MTSMVTFTDWYNAQSDEYMSGPDDIRFAAAKQAYGWSLLTRGKSIEKMLSGGTAIAEKVMLSGANTFANYGANDPLVPVRTESMTTLRAPWRFGSWNMQWTKQEEILNGASPEFTSAARVMKYYDFRTKLETQWQYDAAEGIEASAFAKPDPDTMEDFNGLAPYSIWAHLNDHANGLFNDVVAGKIWTTKMGTNPTAAGKTRLRPRLFGYQSALVNPATGLSNILDAMDEAFVHMNYKRPFVATAQAQQNFESEGWSRKIGLWSQPGITRIMSLLRQRNTNYASNGTASTQMGMGDLEYKGVEQFAIPAMTTSAVYHSDYGTPATLVTEGASTTNIGPRGLLIDTDALKIVFNRERYFAREKPRQLDNQPFTNVVWGDVYYQITCMYPWLCGVIAPGTVTGTFAGGNQLLTTTNGTPYTAY